MRFSVVLPSYNVQDYLPETLERLCRQTFVDFEVIVVDDAATDQTANIVEDYEKIFLDKGIGYHIITHEKNKGLSQARNSGLAAAQGEYVLFLDADDIFEENALEILNEKICGLRNVEKQPDVILYGFSEDYYDSSGKLTYSVSKSRREKFYLVEHMDRNQEGKKEGNPARVAYAEELVELEQTTMFGYAWNKVYRTAFLKENQLTFETITHIEDILFNCNVAQVANSFVVIPEILYHYRNQGQVRLTSKYLPDYFELQKRRIRRFIDLQEHLISCDFDSLPERTKEVMANFYFRAFQSMMTREIGHKSLRKDILTTAQRETEEELYQKLAPHLSREGKMAKLLYAPLAKGNFASAYNRSVVISLVQRKFPNLFAKLKQHR